MIEWSGSRNMPGAVGSGRRSWRGRAKAAAGLRTERVLTPPVAGLSAARSLARGRRPPVVEVMGTGPPTVGIVGRDEPERSGGRRPGPVEAPGRAQTVRAVERSTIRGSGPTSGSDP